MKVQEKKRAKTKGMILMARSNRNRPPTFTPTVGMLVRFNDDTDLETVGTPTRAGRFVTARSPLRDMDLEVTEITDYGVIVVRRPDGRTLGTFVNAVHPVTKP